jgi:hypothetical protein
MPRIGGDAAVGRAAGDGLERSLDGDWVWCFACLFVVGVGDVTYLGMSTRVWCDKMSLEHFARFASYELVSSLFATCRHI